MVDFSNRKDVERWLEGKPREVAIVIAARAALRVVPLLAKNLNTRGRASGGFRRRQLFPVLRASAASWTVARYPAKSAEIQKHARAAVYTARGAASDLDSAAQASASAADAASSTDTAFAIFAASAADAAANALITDELADGTVSYVAVSADATAMDGATRASNLADSPLWLMGTSIWARDNWGRLKHSLLALNEDWDVWTSWYDARLEGRPAFEVLEVGRATIADKTWDQGPKVANAEIKRLIEEYSKTRPKFRWGEAKWGEFEWDGKDEPLTIPTQRPATVETIWSEGRLTISKKPAKTDLSKKEFEAALSALRAELRELVDDVSAEANIDKRPAAFLRRLAERIPETMPQQDELFRLGHIEAILAGYAKTVDQEWPDFLASHYHAVSLQFDRTLRQAPLWREFKRNAAKETLSEAQVADSTSLAREAASALQQSEAATFVDPAIPQSLEQLADALPVAKAGEEPPSDAIEAGKELLAADLVESVNNILKPIAEVALSAAREYVEGVGKGLKKAAKKQGPIDGEKAFKWLRRLAIGGTAGGGSFVGLSNLIAKFPEAFAWLERVLHFLK